MDFEQISELFSDFVKDLNQSKKHFLVNKSLGKVEKSKKQEKTSPKGRVQKVEGGEFGTCLI